MRWRWEDAHPLLFKTLDRTASQNCKIHPSAVLVSAGRLLVRSCAARRLTRVHEGGVHMPRERKRTGDDGTAPPRGVLVY